MIFNNKSHTSPRLKLATALIMLSLCVATPLLLRPSSWIVIVGFHLLISIFIYTIVLGLRISRQTANIASVITFVLTTTTAAVGFDILNTALILTIAFVLVLARQL